MNLVIPAKIIFKEWLQEWVSKHNAFPRKLCFYGPSTEYLIETGSVDTYYKVNVYIYKSHKMLYMNVYLAYIIDRFQKAIPTTPYRA